MRGNRSHCEYTHVRSRDFERSVEMLVHLLRMSTDVGSSFARLRIALMIVSALFAVPVLRAQFDPTDPVPGYGFSEVQFLPTAPIVIAPNGVGGAGPSVSGLESPAGGSSASKNYDQLIGWANGQKQAVRSHIDPSLNVPVEIDESITHQPLIHVKVRVIEVQRSNNLSAASVLEYVSSAGGNPTATSGSPLNNTPLGRNTSGVSQFGVPGLATNSGLANGAGALLNLTSQHINWVASLLATEFNADTITAPQVTTLNGKNVTFRAGSQVPFELGQNRILGNNNNVQQFFYKPVGTYISVTPQIVNWGHLHEGLGAPTRRDGEPYVSDDLKNAIVRDEDIRQRDFYGLLVALRDSSIELGENNWVPIRTFIHSKNPQFNVGLLQRLPESRRGFALSELGFGKSDVLGVLNQLIEEEPLIDRYVLHDVLGGAIELPQRLVEPPCQNCNWNASDCTINLNIAVRLSEVGSTNATAVDAGVPVETTRTTEQNVRAISNVVQVKSGNGVVMGGLISMKDSESISKVPVLGDIPVVGAAFRSKKTERIKTETLIFIEAEVLPGFEDCVDECGQCAATAKTAADFPHARAHLVDDLTSGVLNAGLHRSGLAGDYLPRPAKAEVEYWKQYHRTIRHKRTHAVTAQLGDTLR